MRLLILLAVTLALAEAQRVKFPNGDRRPLKVVKLNKEDKVLEKAKAEVAAVIDAMMQTPAAEVIRATIIDPLKRREQTARTARAAARKSL